MSDDFEGADLILHPGRLSQLGPGDGLTFCLVTSPNLAGHITVVPDGGYTEYRTFVLRPGQAFEDLLRAEIPEDAHIFGISPEVFFQSPDSSLLGPRRKLIAMACTSTPTTTDGLRHFLDIIERTSAGEQAAFSDRFFDLAEDADHLEYVDERHGTVAVLEHLRPDLVWNQQAGPLEWGEQQIIPSGEISVLPVEIREFSEALALPLEGELTLRGHPILHGGTPSYTREDQARIHRALAPMEDHAVICTVERGRVTRMRPYDDGARGVIDMLEALFTVDARYRHVWEIGHAINTSLEILPGNHAMNEVYGGRAGCLHWGFGLTPFTQYHLDVIVPDTVVRTPDGRVLLGEPLSAALP